MGYPQSGGDGAAAAEDEVLSPGGRGQAGKHGGAGVTLQDPLEELTSFVREIAQMGPRIEGRSQCHVWVPKNMEIVRQVVGLVNDCALAGWAARMGSPQRMPRSAEALRVGAGVIPG